MSFPISRSIADFFYLEISGILSENINPDEKIINLRQILDNILSETTSQELQFFSTAFARWKYVCDRYQIPSGLSHDIDAIRRFELVVRKKRFTCNEAIIETSSYALARLLLHFSGVEIPLAISQCMPVASLEAFRPIHSETIPLLRAVVIGKPSLLHTPFSAIIISVATEDENNVRIALTENLMYLGNIVWNGAVLHLTNLRRSKKNNTLLTTTSETLAIIEPDVLLDVTSIAECFQSSGVNFKLYFLQRFKRSHASLSLLLGTIVNSLFDALLENIEANFEVKFEEALRSKPLSTLAGLGDAPDALDNLASIARRHFESLRSVVCSMNIVKFTVEPSFISPLYGLQGRLDLLLEYVDDPKRKTIIELKSGAAPNADAASKLFEGQQSLPLGMWSNHYAQVTAYNLLLDSAFPGRTGDSSTLYSTDLKRPLRNAPNITQSKSAVLNVRNLIVAAEYGLMNRKFALFDSFSKESFGVIPTFLVDEVNVFSGAYNNATTVERQYYQAFTSFLLHEQYAARVGLGERYGFAALWQQSIDEKRTRMTALTDLKLLPEESDFEQLHLSFARNALPSPFRVGDMIVLYPIGANAGDNPIERQIIKATIRETTHNRVRVSIRNKSFDADFFTSSNDDNNWVIENDHIDAGYEHLHRALGAVLRASSSKRKLLLGLTPPRHEQREISFSAETESLLQPNQRELAVKALSSRDYFLLQGPPGTGKTSVLLKSIAEYLYQQTDETVLLLAYTNRAVDEICTSLNRISPKIPFIRIGSKEQTEFEENMLWKIAERLSPIELSSIISSTRFFVSTATSALANPELFSVKKFTILIADEAAQLIEPYLAGLFVRVDRCILIGDEKQLPAIVLQNEREASINSSACTEICLNDLRMSLFERLLRCCKKNNWDNSYGMLQGQARMHKAIENTVNQRFYDNNLRTMHDWQTAQTASFPFGDSLICSISSVGRVVFIPSPLERYAKIHRTEACRASRIASSIATAMKDNFTSKTLGIITPFRSQIAEIIRMLPSHIQSFITVDTVERYQGSERDIIILSMSISFVSQLSAVQSITNFDGRLTDRKLNVALTRAREQIIILGCEEILRQSPIYAELLDEIPRWDWNENVG